MASTAAAHQPPLVARQRPLMADIARLAGVSIATVSRALRGDPMVRPATRAHIARIAEGLDYGVDERARNLRLRQATAVMVVVPTVAVPMAGNPWHLELLCSIAEALAAQGRTLLLARPAVLDAAALAREVATGRAAGLIVVDAARQHAPLDRLALRGVPCVAWGAPVDGQAHASVGIDDTVGGRLAAGHLLDRGARRVVFVGDLGQPGVAQRHAGYLQAHQARGVVPATVALPCGADALVGPLDDPALLLAQALRQAPALDGVCAGSDLLALGVVQALQRAGRRVPEDVLVTGHGDSLLAAQCQPPLSSVGLPAAQAGAALVQSLHDLCDGAPPAPVLLAVRLQVRASSAAGLGVRRRAIAGPGQAQAHG